MPPVHETETFGSWPIREGSAFNASVTSATDASTGIGTVVSLPKLKVNVPKSA